MKAEKRIEDYKAIFFEKIQEKDAEAVTALLNDDNYKIGEGKDRVSVFVSVRNAQGQTALHIASMSSSVEITKMLIEHGADVNAKDANGNTSIHYAVEREANQKQLYELYTNPDSCILSLLISRGADLTDKSNFNDECSALGRVFLMKHLRHVQQYDPEYQKELREQWDEKYGWKKSLACKTPKDEITQSEVQKNARESMGFVVEEMKIYTGKEAKKSGDWNYKFSSTVKFIAGSIKNGKIYDHVLIGSSAEQEKAKKNWVRVEKKDIQMLENTLRSLTVTKNLHRFLADNVLGMFIKEIEKHILSEDIEEGIEIDLLAKWSAQDTSPLARLSHMRQRLLAAAKVEDQVCDRKLVK